MVCHQHHHSLHEGGWNLRGDPFGELVALHPDSRRTRPNIPQSVDDHGPPGLPPSQLILPAARTDRSTTTEADDGAGDETGSPPLFPDSG